MEAKIHPRRPKHLNLFKIKQPLPAVVSILHRISGALLFFPGIPLVLCGMQLLLQSPESYEILIGYWQMPVIKGLLLLSLWFFLHHLCAGIRHVLLDLHIGVALPQARMGGIVVLITGFSLTVLAGVLLW